MRRILVAIASIALLSGGFLYVRARDVSAPMELASNQTHVMLGNASITADVADTEALREQGLSGRRSLSETSGMLFVFQEDGAHAFWMKDMLFSIDMIWLSADKKVVYIVENAAPETYPSSFMPTSGSRYVLEVPAGWAARHAVVLGSVATF